MRLKSTTRGAWRASASIAATALLAAAAALAAQPPPAPAPGPPVPIREVDPPELEPLVGPPAPEEPVGEVAEEMTVKGRKHKKKEELVGPPVDKRWLAEVCPVGEEADGTWLDRSQDRIGWGVCRATLWFDGLFGDQRAIEERDATYGYVQPRLEWNEIDGVEPDLRFRAKFSLPLADRRFNALLGRSTSDERSSESDAGGEQLPESFRDSDDEWLVGLGYSPVRGNRKRLDFDAGLELDTPVEIFTQARYRWHWFLAKKQMVRWRQSMFWRSDDGFGTRLDIDYERVLKGPYVVRWRNGGTYAQHLEGIEWFEELTLFHRIGERQALAYVVRADGETDADVTLEAYGLEVIYRRNILREWLFVEMRPGVEWRRTSADEPREVTPLLGIGIEVQFGDREFE